MKKIAFAVLCAALVGCASPAEDYIRADAAAWVPFDDGGWLDAKIDAEPAFSADKKTALHMLNAGRRARIAHAIAALGSGS